MFDIRFYMQVYDLKKRLMAGERLAAPEVWEALEACRDPRPVVYNIETTNACNMRCEMCPRTTMMTRPIETMSLELFQSVADQIEPQPAETWAEWEAFCRSRYGVPPGDMSENHFFLYVIPKVVVLHGYGDPLLDKIMPRRINYMTQRRIPTYFSCNPANIKLDRVLQMFEEGLGYIKFSVESTDDARHKAIRGQASNFSQSFRDILRLIEEKDRRGLKTVIVITMLDLNKPGQEEEYRRLLDRFQGTDTYVYLKSQDQQWYQDKNEGTKSIHWLEFCQFPWSSMTVKSNGETAMCVEDFNNEIILGDAAVTPLAEIWNGEKYRRLRRDHFERTRGIKCTECCDMTLIGALTS
jgi:radical SAM protein with 4Fe4S-binding SPASM domain